ncbi:MAG: fasciclin domain-containing protein [Acidimicrobiia bacterium]
MKKPLLAIASLVCISALTLGACSSDKKEDSEKKAKTETKTTKPTESMDKKTIVDIAAGDENFSTLVSLVKAAGLVDALSDSNSQLTVFAPTNDAFAKVDAATIEKLKANKDALTQVLTYHVVASKAMSTDLSNGQEVTTLEGSKLTVNISGSEVSLGTDSGGSAKVSKADISASNGVIHVIDTVLIPKDLKL